MGPATRFRKAHAVMWRGCSIFEYCGNGGQNLRLDADHHGTAIQDVRDQQMAKQQLSCLLPTDDGHERIRSCVALNSPSRLLERSSGAPENATLFQLILWLDDSDWVHEVITDANHKTLKKGKFEHDLSHANLRVGIPHQGPAPHLFAEIIKRRMLMGELLQYGLQSKRGE